MVLVDRVPKWYQEDSLVHTPDDESEYVKIRSYYDLLRRQPRQPIQIWKEFTNATVGHETGYLCVRLLCQKMHPLKEVQIYLHDDICDDEDTLLYDKTYKQHCMINSDLIRLSNVSLTSDQYYTVVYYWGLEQPMKIGFPQVLNSEDEAFAPNASLDLIGDQYGIFRRTYKDSITDDELPYTYPKGYPYPIEQDYWFEKRILEEYTTRSERVSELTFVDNSTTPQEAITFKCRIGGTHDIELISTSTTLEVIDTQRDGLIQTENFTYTNILDLEKQITRTSKIIKAEHKIENGQLSNQDDFLRIAGTYRENGLLKAEINQYLGVIPEIKDMADYILIWDVGRWDNKVWAGDDYSMGVYQVRIPYADIPANFNLLTMDELQSIINKCKKVGTKGIPTYWYGGYVDTGIAVEDVEENIGVDIDLDLNIKAGTADEAIALPPMKLLSPQLSYQENVGVNLPLDLGLTSEAFYNVTAFNADTQSDFNQLTVLGQVDASNMKTYPTVADSSNFIRLDQSDKNTTKSATVGASVSGDGGVEGWQNTSQVGNVSQNVYTDSNPYIYNVRSMYLKVGGFNFNIPDDALITYINLHFGGKINGTSGSNFYAKLYTLKGWSNSYAGHWTNNNVLTDENLGFVPNDCGLTGLTGADVNDSNNFYFYVWVDTLVPNANALTTGMSCVITYRTRSGTFMTQRIPATTPSKGTGRWGFLSQTLYENLPSSCTLKYDILRDYADQKYWPGSTSTFGINKSSSIYGVTQSFKPSVSSLVGITLWPYTRTGNPSAGVTFSICKDNSGVPGDVIQSTTLSKTQVIDNQQLFVPFDIINLTTGSTYWLKAEYATGGYDTSNYYNFAAVLDTGTYSNGQMKYYNGSSWATYHGNSDDLWFATIYPNTISSDLDYTSLPDNLRSTDYVPLYIRGKLTTSDISYTPKVDKITLTREEVQ